MSVTLTEKPVSSNPDGCPALQLSPCTGCERVTLNNFWPDALPFLCLVAIAGVTVYLASGI